jgi:hypothetical protein
VVPTDWVWLCYIHSVQLKAAVTLQLSRPSFSENHELLNGIPTVINWVFAVSIV